MEYLSKDTDTVRKRDRGKEKERKMGVGERGACMFSPNDFLFF